MEVPRPPEVKFSPEDELQSFQSLPRWLCRSAIVREEFSWKFLKAVTMLVVTKEEEEEEELSELPFPGAHKLITLESLPLEVEVVVVFQR